MVKYVRSNKYVLININYAITRPNFIQVVMRKKKIFLVPVTRPYLFFLPDPKPFFFHLNTKTIWSDFLLDIQENI